MDDDLADGLPAVRVARRLLRLLQAEDEGLRRDRRAVRNGGKDAGREQA